MVSNANQTSFIPAFTPVAVPSHVAGVGPAQSVETLRWDPRASRLRQASRARRIRPTPSRPA
jgi:hypothetical protein